MARPGSSCAAVGHWLRGERQTADDAKAARLVDLNAYALMRPEPVPQIVSPCPPSESLGHDESWSADQKTLLKEIPGAGETVQVRRYEETRGVPTTCRDRFGRGSLMIATVRTKRHGTRTSIGVPSRPVP